ERGNGAGVTGVSARDAGEIVEESARRDRAAEEVLEDAPGRALETESIEPARHPPVPAGVALRERAAERLDAGAEVGGHDRTEGIAQHVAWCAHQLAPHRPPRPLGVWPDAQVALGDLGPHPARIRRGVAVHAELEERPGDVERDPGMLRPDRVAERRRDAQVPA